MSTSKYFLPYRGNITALVEVGSTLAFVTEHEEAQATAIYQLTLDDRTLQETPLSSGGTCIVTNGQDIWVGSSDGHIHFVSPKGVTSFGSSEITSIQAMALLSQDRLALIDNNTLVIAHSKTGEPLQSLPLPAQGSAICADPTGDWLVVGTQRGQVSVFTSEDKNEFTLSESETLHEGSVTALLFEPEELRFLSAGSDQKLLLTHARGRLEPEDRGRGQAHDDIITALVQTSGERFISGSRDKSCKTWLRKGGARPATLTDGVGKVTALAIVSKQLRPHLAIACSDNSIRLFSLDASGKFGEAVESFYDAYAMADDTFSKNTPSDVNLRQKSLHDLAQYNDSTSLKMIAKQVKHDSDVNLRIEATQILANSKHGLAKSLLEPLLAHKDEAVRLASFNGLFDKALEDDFSPIDLALKTRKADVALLAIERLAERAKTDDRAMVRLIDNLNTEPFSVRCAALAKLEQLYDSSPEANIIAMSASFSDIREASLKRLVQRDFLSNKQVQSLIRKHLSDKDPDVRITAFYVSLLSAPALADHLRSKDSFLHQQLFDIENFYLANLHGLPEPKAAKLPKPKTKLPTLKSSDLEPLLNASVSHAQNISAMGGYALALLNDPRALGTLLLLSQESDPSVRVKVCEGLAVLDNTQATERLKTLLGDSEAFVRDAAFSALCKIYGSISNPKKESITRDFIEPALQSHPSIRQQTLQLLIKDSANKKLSQNARQTCTEQLQKALNNTEAKVRSEAFKTLLKVDDSELENTLRQMLECHYPDIRREVQTELMGLSKQKWAWSLLLTLVNDPDPNTGEETFQYCLQKTKGKDVAPMAAAIESRHKRVVEQAIKVLISKPSKESQALLIKASEHSDKATRKLAVDALIDSNAESLLNTLMDNEHADVRLSAAKALAKQGNTNTLVIFQQQLEQPLPEDKKAQGNWQINVIHSLNGLQELGHTNGLAMTLSFLEHDEATIRKAAARAMVTCSMNHSDLSTLKDLLQHRDKEVSERAAFALVLNGHDYIDRVFSSPVLSALEKLMAGLVTGREDYLIGQINEAGSHEMPVMLSLLALEHYCRSGNPTRLLAMLSTQQAHIRINSVTSLVHYISDTLMDYLPKLIQSYQAGETWLVGTTALNDFFLLLIHSTPSIQFHTVQLLPLLAENDAQAWEHAWSIHSSRYHAQIEQIKSEQTERASLSIAAEDLYAIAIGAYLVLAREIGGHHLVTVRNVSLVSLLKGWQEQWPGIDAAKSAFVQALNDPAETVRERAFECLQTIEMDNTELASECLETGRRDMGIRGLTLLSGDASTGREILEQAMTQRTDELAQEAGKLLIKKYPIAEVAATALQAVSQTMRAYGIHWLEEEYTNDANAKKVLQQALQSRYRDVRERAACALAQQKDASAFEGLVIALNAAEKPRQQKEFCQALVQLGDQRAVDALLDRLDNDPNHTADPKLLLDAVGQFRLASASPRLLRMLNKEAWQKAAIDAIYKTSGHDQRIKEDEHGHPTGDADWLEKQYPRHDEVLKDLMESCLALGQLQSVKRCLDSARWSQSSAVNSVLNTLCHHPDDRLRNQAIEACAWRAKHRDMPKDALIQALEQKDETSRFLAAEALAKLGLADGANILMASVQLLSDFQLRERAVLALGELADVSSLDLLLNIASDSEHALREVAAQAIGHLQHTDKAETIFNLLSQFMKDYSWRLRENAVQGLRYFDSEKAWELIRTAATSDEDYDVRRCALRMLAFNDHPSTRDLLLNELAKPYFEDTALQSARELFGKDSLLPDYAYARGGSYLPDEIIERLQNGEPSKLFELLADCHPDVFGHLSAQLLLKSEATTAAVEALNSPHSNVVAIACRVLAYHNKEASLEPAIESWQQRFKAGLEQQKIDLGIILCLEQLAWACGRLRIGRTSLAKLCVAHIDLPSFDGVRYQALEALLSFTPLNDEEQSQLLNACSDRNPKIRELAMAYRAQQKIGSDSLIENNLGDQRGLQQVLNYADLPDTQTALTQAFAHAHYQASVTRVVIEQCQTDALVQVAKDNQLEDSVRLGAIESIAHIIETDSIEALAGIGKDETIDEDLRKAAWRNLRRLRRNLNVTTS